VVEADAILVRAWQLAFGESSDGGRAELESLLPALVAAGFVESDERIWNFTPGGVARVNELVPD
jgi:hypothetical protein